MRLRALELVSADYRKLADRAKRRMPTGAERAELTRCERVLEQLQAMAPAGDLILPATKGWLE